MNKDSLDTFVSVMTDMLKASKDFAVDQLPSVCKEILVFGVADNVGGLVFAVLLCLVAYKLHTKVRDNHWDEATYLFVFIIVLVSLVLAGTATHNLLQIMFAPKVFLLEYFKDLIPHK
jgi:hypothetical protein